MYKQDYLWDGSRSSLYSYQKPSHYVQLHDDPFSIHTDGKNHCKDIKLYNRAKKQLGIIPQDSVEMFSRIRDWDASVNAKKVTQCWELAHTNEGVFCSRTSWPGWYPFNDWLSVQEPYELSRSWNKTSDLYSNCYKEEILCCVRPHGNFFAYWNSCNSTV